MDKQIKLNRAAYQRQIENRIMATGILVFLLINVIIAAVGFAINAIRL